MGEGGKKVIYNVLHIISNQHDVPSVVDHSDILSNIKAIMTSEDYIAVESKQAG